MGIIYCARNTVNGKCYIGKTMGTLEHRRYAHEKARGNKPMAIARALAKYGPSSFRWTILDHAGTEAELDVLERIYIDMFSTSIKECGYNLTHGGEGQIPNDETKAKMSAARLGKPNPKRRVPCPEHIKLQIAETLKRKYASGEITPPNLGKPIPPHVKKAMRDGWAKLTKDQRGTRDWTPEARRQHSIALTGRKCPHNKQVPHVCVVCGKGYSDTATKAKFCPECKAKYTEGERNKLRTDGFVKKTIKVEYTRVARPDGKLMFRVSCTTCGTPFECGTVTRKQCPACRGEQPPAGSM